MAALQGDPHLFWGNEIVMDGRKTHRTDKVRRFDDWAMIRAAPQAASGCQADLGPGLSQKAQKRCAFLPEKYCFRL